MFASSSFGALSFLLVFPSFPVGAAKNITQTSDTAPLACLVGASPPGWPLGWRPSSPVGGQFLHWTGHWAPLQLGASLARAQFNGPRRPLGDGAPIGANRARTHTAKWAPSVPVINLVVNSACR